MMKCLISYSKPKPSTIGGYSIVVTQTYSSFNVEEIIALEENLKEMYGEGLAVEYNLEKQDDRLIDNKNEDKAKKLKELTDTVHDILLERLATNNEVFDTTDEIMKEIKDVMDKL